MKRTRISDLIEYIEPSKGDRRMVCSGIIVHTSPKVVIDTNFGHPETADFLSRERPQIVILTHYHADHSGVGRVSADMGAHLFIPAGEEAYLKDIENYSGLIAPNDQVMRLALEQRLRNGRYRELGSQGYSLYDDATDFGLEQSGALCKRFPLRDIPRTIIRSTFRKRKSFSPAMWGWMPLVRGMPFPTAMC